MGLVGALESLRHKIGGKRIEIVKGYECQEYSEKQRNLKRNYHVTGVATEIRAEGIGIKDLYLMASTLEEVKCLGLNVVSGLDHTLVIDRKRRRMP